MSTHGKHGKQITMGHTTHIHANKHTYTYTHTHTVLMKWVSLTQEDAYWMGGLELTS